MSEEQAGGDPLIAFVLASDAKLPSKEALLQAWAHLWPDDAGPEEMEVKDGSILACTLDGEMAFVSAMPAPFPWEDLEGPCLTAWHWPEAAKELKDHPAHFIVTLIGGQDPPVERARRLTRLVTALLRVTPSLGVYWGGAPAINSAVAFTAEAETMQAGELPLTNWVEFRLFQDDAGKLCLVTSGLAPLGVMEIEVLGSAKEPMDALDLVYGIALYTLQHGNVILDGHTVGGDENERITARHVPSVWEREGPVLRLEA